MTHQILATKVLLDEGTVVVFDGTFLDNNRRCSFAVDHRYAQHLAEAIESEGDVVADVPEWAVISRG